MPPPTLPPPAEAGARLPGKHRSTQKTSGLDHEPKLIGVGWWLTDAPAWLASAALHLTVLILLALLAIAIDEDRNLTLTGVFAEDLGEQLIEPQLDLSAEIEVDELQQSLTPEFLEPVPLPLAAPTPTQISPNARALTSLLDIKTPGAAFAGREEGTRIALLKAYGGTERTEAAVLAGLRWLRRKQQRDGGWSLEGRYANPANTENREAATAMALLAFQGAGHLPEGKGEFSKTVREGWEWLLKRQQPDGSFFSEGRNNHRYYTDALATIALCELFGMTRNNDYLLSAQSAIDHLIDGQTTVGGWKYRPREGNDLSVTGWVLMALKSGRMAGLEVPSEVFEQVTEFLDNDVSRAEGSQYVYERSIVFNPEQPPAMTAVGLLCRQYLGWPKDFVPLRQGVDLLLNHPPEWIDRRRDIYYWYYATQVCRHIGGDTWNEWNGVIREVLPDHQVKSGSEEGSWSPVGDRWGSTGGRLYQTCLSIYVLEVYYRHLPLYREGVTIDGK
ncbi:prenyltransferase/squalene oxidase repeat-containing protein [Botrimarina hoheduenensis]|uniref:Squalene--hopene cyclase n=1 Tax=Botrimarina hoheduenensis TaxID=2528000 RepID=A0A5C5WEJ6_9BACT|nr:prenyltransferase/squalene oxidase repeat-containing protein [Botrimarina hoheduenensis]TWT48917.1 Squalene--hopene cyclase [Botrimarina hoheduenensis]